MEHVDDDGSRGAHQVTAKCPCSCDGLCLSTKDESDLECVYALTARFMSFEADGRGAWLLGTTSGGCTE